MGRVRVRAAAGVLALTTLAACTSTTTQSPPTPVAPESGGPTAPDEERPTTPAPRPGPVTIAVAGDIHFEGALRPRLDDPATALSPIEPALAAADLTVVNLETAIGRGGTPAPDKRFLFQAPPTALDALVGAGVDVATLANNHVLDFGRDPLPELFAAADSSPLEIVGVGRDEAEAFEPALTDVDGTTIATVGATTAGLDPTADPTAQWAATRDAPGTADAIDSTRLLRTVARVDRTADVVVVYLHWGTQGQRCPDDTQRTLATDLVAAGADVVVGSHTHQLQGDGRLGRGYVAYGLGNFAWYTQSETTSSTGVLTLTVRPPVSVPGRARVTDAVWTPARIGADGLPRTIPEPEVPAFEDERRSLRGCADLRAP